MPVEVLMPELGQTADEITLVQWLKQEGEEVQQGEPLFEVQTDKVTTEVEAIVGGILAKILVGENEAVPSKTPVAIIARPDEMPLDLDKLAGKNGVREAPGVTPENVEKGPTGAGYSPEEPGEGAGRLKASPVARRLAEENGIDLNTIQGTGPDGRITKEDVLKAIAEKTAAPRTGGTLPEPDHPAGEGAIPLSGIRKLIADRMSRSKREIPHFYVENEVDMTEAVKLREALNNAAARHGVQVSFTDLFVKAVAMVLEEFPAFNALVEEGQVRYVKDINVGIAVGLAEGIIVPFVPRANEKTLLDIAAIARDLITRAREGKLTLDNVNGGTFTISNLGMYDVSRFVAVINPPQVAILAVGKMALRPVVKGGEITASRVATLTLSCDHRVIDGVAAARFLERLKFYLENPYSLLLSR